MDLKLSNMFDKPITSKSEKKKTKARLKKKTYNLTNSEKDVTSASEVPTKPMPANFLQ